MEEGELTGVFEGFGADEGEEALEHSSRYLQPAQGGGIRGIIVLPRRREKEDDLSFTKEGKLLYAPRRRI